MYKEILIPTARAHTVKVPKGFYGKKVEVIVKEVSEPSAKKSSLPANLKNKKFWEDIPYNSSFPSLTEIRMLAWPEKK